METGLAIRNRSIIKVILNNRRTALKLATSHQQVDGSKDTYQAVDVVIRLPLANQWAVLSLATICLDLKFR